MVLAKAITFLLLLLATASVLLATSAASESSGWSSDEEFGLDSEWSRRILAATTNYISYDALKRDSVPCTKRGASYYNCRPGAEANPYSRGCNAITMCRS